MKICLVASAGGHLKEITFLEKFYKKYPRFFITFKRENSLSLSNKEKVYFVEDPGRNLVRFLKNAFQSFKIILKERPDIVISTGAGVAIAVCYFGKLIGSDIIFIESFCRTQKPSLTGKIIYPISDIFFVQWKRLKFYFPKAVYGGSLI